MMHLTEIAALIAVVLATACADSPKHIEKYGEKWGYEKDSQVEGLLKPKDWGKDYKDCKGKAQSPINIDTKKTEKSKLGPLEVKFTLKDDKTKFFNGTLINNGHAPTFLLDKDSGNVTMKFDKKEYILEKFLYHFGCEDKIGSEHKLDNKSFEGEVQMVFYNKKHKEFEKALKEKDGLLVIGAFIKKDRNPFVDFMKYTREIYTFGPLNVISNLDKGTPINFEYLDLKNMIPELETGKAAFYTYKGSLTTPGCYETVRWIVLKEPISMSQYMFSFIRTMRSQGSVVQGWPMNVILVCDNYRPVQDIKKRKVEFYEPKKKN